MIRCILFDLDDTLYLEDEFVQGGFRSVAATLEQRGYGASETIFGLLHSLHWREGRDHVFDKAAERLGFPKSMVPDLVEIYYRHPLTIRLAPDAESVLKSLRTDFKLGCVTDGHKQVQWRKVEALDLRSVMDTIVVADELGRMFWKPDPLAILTACGNVGVHPQESLFVGDNPERDRRGARNAGARSVRIRRAGGYFAGSKIGEDRADFEAASLVELPGILRRLKDAMPAERSKRES